MAVDLAQTPAILLVLSPFSLAVVGSCPTRYVQGQAGCMQLLTRARGQPSSTGKDQLPVKNMQAALFLLERTTAACSVLIFSASPSPKVS